MKILVTGTTGQLGYDVMKALAERRIEAIGAGRGDFDITDVQTARSFIIKHHPDAVIHCAAYTAVDKAEEDEDLCRRVNVDGTVTIATVCRDIGAKMIYISTDYVFPGTGHQFYEVDAPKGPLNLYGQSKLDGEEAVKNLLQHYFIVRTSWAFGFNGGNFVKTMLRLGRGRKEINVVCDQIGSPTYTADLASLLCDMVVTDKYGVYHATRVLMDLYSTQIAKLGSNDRESEFLYQARLNGFAVDPRSFMFPSAEGSYKKALKQVEEYKKSLDTGKGTYNCRTDDLYAALNTVVGENMLGYALGLLADAQDIPFYTLDNRIYEVQGMVLVIRDFVKALYDLYPEIAQKNNAENMAAAMQFMNDICTYDPMYITSSFNSGELIISYLMFTKNRLEDIRDSLRI